LKKYDIAKVATFKVVYSLFLFPVTFLIEAVVLYLFFGLVFSVLFAILIIPLSYFTLYFIEWLYEGGLGIPVSFRKLRKNFRRRISRQLEEQSIRIKHQIDDLAARLD
jgi:hypothetical protein